MSDHVEIRPLKVGNIENKYLRRLALICWFPFLLCMCVIGNICIGLFWIIKAVLSRVTYLCKDFKACWISPKENE